MSVMFPEFVTLRPPWQGISPLYDDWGRKGTSGGEAIQTRAPELQLWTINWTNITGQSEHCCCLRRGVLVWTSQCYLGRGTVEWGTVIRLSCGHHSGCQPWPGGLGRWKKRWPQTQERVVGKQLPFMGGALLLLGCHSQFQGWTVIRPCKLNKPVSHNKCISKQTN